MDLLRVLGMGTLLLAGWAPIALAATPTANATSTTSASGPSHSANCDNRSATRPVEVGVYVNKMQGVDFKDSKFLLDFYIWFRWKPDGPLEKYDPLATMELINGINKKESGVDRKTGDEMGDGQGNYAVARVTATIVHNWKLRAFPFDHHDIEVHVEDSKFVAKSLQFKPDKKNSGPSTPDELALPGWRFTKFDICAADKRYHTNFGDTSFTAGSNRGESVGDPGASEKGSASAYSRLTFSMRMERAGPGPAIKLLAPAIIATLVAFVAFLIRPTDVDPRFGLGIGALFAVAASGLVVASYVPDSDELTMADMVYMAAMLFIGASLVQSAVCLKWCESGKTKWKVVNLWSIIVFPLLFVVAIVGIKNAWS